LTGWTLKGIRELFYGDIKQSKLFSMREYLQVNYVIIGLHVIHYSCLIFIKILLNSTYVRMCMSWRQCAWIVNKRLFTSHQRLNEEHLNDNSNMISLKQGKNHHEHIKDKWEQWLVGFTDGDGNFHISYQGGKWGLSYKLTQSRYNLRVLHYIKKQLGVGSITKDGTKGQYFIRDRKILETVIIPIFDKYPLLTRKYYSYILAKKFIYIWNCNNLTMLQKNAEFEKILKDGNELVGSYVSPAISHLTNCTHEEIKSTISKAWLIGFIESQNTFFVHTNNGKYLTRFSLVLRESNILLLQLIKRLLHIPNTVYVTSKNDCVLTTSNSRAILNIISYFEDQFKGIRSLEFKLWSKANFYKNTHVKKVNKIDNILRGLEVKNITLSHSSGSLSSHEVRSIIDSSVYSSSVKKSAH
jgi:hypothetical protein